MEQNNKPQDEDRLGALTDDILLSILGSVDLATAARTSALSTRWRSLPWLLPDLNPMLGISCPPHAQITLLLLGSRYIFILKYQRNT